MHSASFCSVLAKSLLKKDFLVIFIGIFLKNLRGGLFFFMKMWVSFRLFGVVSDLVGVF